MISRAWIRSSMSAATLLGAGFLTACNEGDGSQFFNLNDLADQLARVASGVILEDPTQASADDLRSSIGFIMTNQGFPSFAARQESNTRTPATTPAGAILDAMQVDFSEPFPTSIVPRPPLGVTCDWNPDTGGWKGGGSDRVGTPADDAIRFEMYETLGTSPVLPLSPIGTFVDVVPTQQGGSGNSVIDVTVNAGDANSSDVLFTYNLTGTSTPDVLDLFMSGGIDNAGGVLNFFFTVDQVRGSAGGSIEDLMIESQVGVDFSGSANSVLTVDKLNNLNLEYEFDFDEATRVITNGDVTLDGEVVATISGTQTQPIFTITSDRLSSQDRINLTSIFLNAQTVTGRVTDFFLLAHCVGSERQEECQRL